MYCFNINQLLQLIWILRLWSRLLYLITLNYGYTCIISNIPSISWFYSPGDALIDLILVKCKQNSCNLAVSTAAEVVKFNPEWRCKHVNTDEIGFNRNSSRNEVDDTLWWLLKYFRILLGSFEHVVRIASYHWTSSPNHLKPNQKQKISQDHM